MTLAALKANFSKMRKQYEDYCNDSISIYCEPDQTICQKGETKVSVPIVKLRPYQQEPRNLLMSGKIKRIFDVLPRRAGKETTWWQVLIECAIRKRGSYAMIYPELAQGRRIIWNGAIELIEEKKSVAFLDMIPAFYIARKNSQDMTIKLINGSVIQILGSDKGVDKQRGTNFIGAVFSEFAYQDPRTYQNMMPMFRQNNGWVVLQTTFNGLNHAYHYMQNVKNNDKWFCRVESAKTLVDESNRRYITDEMIDEDRKAGLAEFLIQQEYYNVVSLNEDSMYFAKAMTHMMDTNRIRKNVTIPGIPVYTASDLGQNDETVVILFQLEEMQKPRIIHQIAGTDKPYIYYLNAAREYCTKNNLILETNFAPHDVANRNATSITPLEEAQKNGFVVIRCPAPTNKLTSIIDMRNMLYSTMIEKDGCKRLIDCLSNYSKIYNEKMGVYENRPKHDWASHGVDAFQTMTIAIVKHLIPLTDYGIVRYND